MQKRRIIPAFILSILSLGTDAASLISTRATSGNSSAPHSYQLVDAGANPLGAWFPASYNNGFLLLSVSTAAGTSYASIQPDLYFNASGFLVPQTTPYYASPDCQGPVYYPITKSITSNLVSTAIQGKKLYLWTQMNAVKSFTAQSSYTYASNGATTGYCQNGSINLPWAANISTFALALDLGKVLFPLQIIRR